MATSLSLTLARTNDSRVLWLVSRMCIAEALFLASNRISVT